MKIGYARVSTRDQNPLAQVEALQAEGCERVFTETASGASRDRPQLAAALDYVRAGDTLVVWKVDRLARSVRQLLETGEQLKARGIGLKVLTQPIDTTTPGGELVFQIMGAIAQFERELIRERSRAGLDAARAAGRVGGRTPKLNEGAIEEAKTLLRNPAIKVGDVARRFGVQPSTLYRYIPGGRSAVTEAA